MISSSEIGQKSDVLFFLKLPTPREKRLEEKRTPEIKPSINPI
jgi:hypothetical protein